VSESGLATMASAYSVRETIDRIAQLVTAKGQMVFARVDHAEGAAKVGLQLRPTEVILFGHPRGGTPLMQDQQLVGLDLPLKALAWEDAAGRVWLTYDEPEWLARRYGLGDAGREALAAVAAGMKAVIDAATAMQAGTGAQ